MRCGGVFQVRFETNKKNDGHVLNSYIMLYLDSIAQMGEHRTFNPRVAGSNPARVMAKRLHEIKFIVFQA